MGKTPEIESVKIQVRIKWTDGATISINSQPGANPRDVWRKVEQFLPPEQEGAHERG